ncbi:MULTISPECIES: PglL family O-oligosaccharyltransferase [unclassified Serratia (in: enterobacteria)]|uniref:PglL family O-oligosaccharyltransferase n=1 Tax=unclassified Serratia (in: enterobacteria) TaxID=2647522 RepID=UPI002ED1584E|nr:Wzy polymerase domain-containing protein [Serratia sp. C2(2)]MEE4447623.1 Wzy polymerase domain-containing protein [Serratia sp. C2(1)]
MIFDRVFFLFVFLLFIPLAIYIPNPGGMGLALPFNLLTYGGAALLIGGCWRATPLHRVVITPSCRAIIAACLLLAMPVIFTRPEWKSTAVWRLAGLFAGAVFYFTWLQVRMTARQRHAVLYVILSAAAVQALIVLLQLFAPAIAQSWIPSGSLRAFGIFQQPNVLASFIATGLALAQAAFVLPGFRLLEPRAECWRRRTLAVVLVLLPMVLVWVQSRTGWLAGALVLGLFVLCFCRRYPQVIAIASLLMAGGTLVGVLVLWWGSELGGALRYASHAGSNHARYTMLRDTLAMIAEKPLLGWGYGGFEYSFQYFRINQTPPTAVTEIARHPHNELLLWWVEGGMVALLGMLLLVWAGFKLLACARWHDKRTFACGKASAGEALALCVALLPIALHSQTEYPFYLSALHWLVFLLLLAMLDRLVGPRLGAGCGLKPWRLPMLALSLAALFVMATGFYSARVLTQAERGGLQDMRQVEALPGWVSWMHEERLQFDRQLAGLLAFNRTRDEQRLETYAQWAQRYLNHRIDKNVYANLLVILYQQQEYVRADELRYEAALLFPHDRRFARSSF